MVEPNIVVTATVAKGNDIRTSETGIVVPTTEAIPRQNGGKFAKGNRAAVLGSPLAKKARGLQEALFKGVTKEDFRKLTRKLMAKAKKGDMDAIKLLFKYTLAEPEKNINLAARVMSPAEIAARLDDLFGLESAPDPEDQKSEAP